MLPLPHASQRDALLYLLRRYPQGVTRTQLADYWYHNKRNHLVCLGWEARNRLSELRGDGFIIDHITLDGQSAWKLMAEPPTVESNGQLRLAMA